MVLGGLKERLGFGGPKTGLEQQANTLKYVATVAGPFYVVWGAANILDWMGYPDEMIMMVLLVGLAMWGSGVYGWHSHQTKECVELNAFPQSKWRFDESTTKAFDLFVPKTGARYYGDIQEHTIEGKRDEKAETHNPAKQLYLVGPFPTSYAYDHPELGVIVFDRAYWVLPDLWNRTFFFQTGGEVWWNGIPVNHPNTESVSLHVYDWEDLMGEKIPVCQVCDSNWHYRHAVEAVRKGKLTLTKDDIATAENMVLKKENIELTLALKTTEEHLDSVLGETSNVEEIIKKRIQDYKKRHGDIMRSGEPWKYRFFNMKTFGIILAVIAVAALLAWLFMR